MSRNPIVKELINTKLASTYGGWIYCENCGENIGYLCYVTYDNFNFYYKCKCGSSGEIHISFDKENTFTISEDKLIIIKNRLSCPEDQSPLFTILDKKLKSYSYEIECIKCNKKYSEEKTTL